ncbi:MAG: hypothetical protein RMK57_05640 [Bryobacterales bacterium]|nr:hypothetical protein [Bryobacteraceae bacterium]MDW8353996.1 hypothetical protein [Bryobacterales bacterium]
MTEVVIRGVPAAARGTWDRRWFVKALAVGGLYYTQRGLFAEVLTLTPAQTQGPYYPDRLPLDQDNDLLIINDNITPAVGTVAFISGRVLDRTGTPIRGALVEIWQADHRGNYIHSQGLVAGGVRDPNFQGYGRFLTASSGEYLFRTIKPGLYPGRIRHVHFKITLPGGRTLTTQLYIEGETGNDGVLNAVPVAQRPAVVRPWVPIPGSAVGALAVTFDIVMDYTPADGPTPSRPTIVSFAGIVNAATYSPGAAPGSWITIFGDSLAPQARTWREEDFAGDSLPTELDGVAVTIEDRPAALYYVSPKQLNALVPSDVAEGPARLVVRNGSGISEPAGVEIKRLSPGFFTFPREYVAAVRSDGALLGPPDLIPGVATVPARPGDAILLFGTGFGPTSPEPPAGRRFQGAYPLAGPVQLRLDTYEVPLAFAGLVGPGLYQFNLTVPDLPDGDYSVTAQVQGVRTEKIALLRVERRNFAGRKRDPDASPVFFSRRFYRRLLRMVDRDMG